MMGDCKISPQTEWPGNQLETQVKTNFKRNIKEISRPDK